MFAIRTFARNINATAPARRLRSNDSWAHVLVLYRIGRVHDMLALSKPTISEQMGLAPLWLASPNANGERF